MISFEEQLQITKSAKQINEYLSVTNLDKSQTYLFAVGSADYTPSREWFEEFRKQIVEIGIVGMVLPKVYLSEVSTFPKKDLKNYLTDYRNIIDNFLNNLEI